jgi:hypothetical protein
MHPIHDAAFNGDLATVERLLEENPDLINAANPSGLCSVNAPMKGCTPLMLAAGAGADALVMRLLALGADVGARDACGLNAAHWACFGDHGSSTLSLLLDAGVPLDARGGYGDLTPLRHAVDFHAPGCVAVLLARGGDALGLNDKANDGETALHRAALYLEFEMLRLLVLAGADPTIRDNHEHTPLDFVMSHGDERERERVLPCIFLLEAAMVEPERPYALIKARALLEAARGRRMAAEYLAARGLPEELQQAILRLAAPFGCLDDRVAEGRELPAVAVERDDHKEKLLACLKYALGLEGGGGWHEGEGPAPQQGMLKKVFVELCEMLVPKWARADM